MSRPMPNYVGNIYGELEVIGIAQGNKQKELICQCSCGTVKQLSVNNVISGNTKSCGCMTSIYQREAKLNWGVKAGINEPLNRRYRSLKYNAENRGLYVYITIELMQSIEMEPCYYCGRYNESGINGIDRYYNDIGYTEDNCVPCCTQCNISKKDYTYKEFVTMCILVADRHGAY